VLCSELCGSTQQRHDAQDPDHNEQQAGTGNFPGADDGDGQHAAEASRDLLRRSFGRAGIWKESIPNQPDNRDDEQCA